MNSSINITICSIALVIALVPVNPANLAAHPRKIENHKMCPLCGMYPARYATFQCQVVFKDGTYEAFDSPLGLLVYLFFSDKTGLDIKPIESVYFRDYLNRKWIDANETYYVVGTNIMGPMGIDFLPVSDKNRAEKLNADEQGALVIKNSYVNKQFLIRAAENNWVHFLAGKIITE